MRVIHERQSQPIVAVVLERVFPHEIFEVEPVSLPEYIGEYGGLHRGGESCRLVGVRLAGFNVISYAGCYWWTNHDHTWKSWHLYVGVSRGAGLRVAREQS